jgi:hypothetical protein
MEKNAKGVYEPVDEGLIEQGVEEIAYVGERVVNKFANLCNVLCNSIFGE